MVWVDIAKMSWDFTHFFIENVIWFEPWRFEATQRDAVASDLLSHRLRKIISIQISKQHLELFCENITNSAEEMKTLQKKSYIE